MSLVLKRKGIYIRLDIYTFLAFYLNIDMLEDFVKSIYMLLLKSEPPAILNIFLAIFSLAVLLFIVFRRRKISWKFILIMLSGIVLYLLSIALTTGITKIISTSITRGILYVLIPIYLFTLIDDLDKLFDALIPYVFIGLFYSALQIPLRNIPLVKDTHYMDFTYNSIIALLVSLGIFLFDCKNGDNQRRNKTLYLLVAFVIFSVNFLYGGRGALLCTAVALLLWLHFIKANRKILYVSLGLMAIGVIAIYYEQFITVLAELFPRSRTIIRILNNNLINTTTSVRMRSWTYIINELMNEPLAIRGFLSDRIYLSGYLNVDLDSVYGSYAHNLILEILFQFGIISIPFIAVGIWKIVKSVNLVKRCISGKAKVIGLMIFALSIGQLAVSSSYLIAKSFGMLVGFVVFLETQNWRKYENTNY